jgi:hypothetical protein
MKSVKMAWIDSGRVQREKGKITALCRKCKNKVEKNKIESY